MKLKPLAIELEPHAIELEPHVMEFTYAFCRITSVFAGGENLINVIGTAR